MFSRCSGIQRSLSKGAISGPDELEKTVAPREGTEKGAIRYIPLECTPLAGQLGYGSLDSVPGELLLEIDWAAVTKGRVQPLWP